MGKDGKDSKDTGTKPCPACKGAGADRSTREPCTTCGGLGRVAK